MSFSSESVLLQVVESVLIRAELYISQLNSLLFPGLFQWYLVIMIEQNFIQMQKHYNKMIFSQFAKEKFSCKTFF